MLIFQNIIYVILSPEILKKKAFIETFFHQP